MKHYPKSTRPSYWVPGDDFFAFTDETITVEYCGLVFRFTCDYDREDDGMTDPRDCQVSDGDGGNWYDTQDFIVKNLYAENDEFHQLVKDACEKLR